MAKKDYLKELGVNAVWLNPIYPSSGVDNGYDVTDFTGIDKVYGTMKDFEIMVKTFAESGKPQSVSILNNIWTWLL